MVTAQIPPIYEEFLDYFLDKATPQQIIDFTPSEKAQERAAYLLERNNAGILTPAEALELEQMLYFDRKVSVLKARSMLALKKSK